MLWSVDIEKVLLGEYWTNRYIVRAAELADATTIAGSIINIERATHKAVVTFTKARVSDTIPLTDVYAIIALNMQGTAPGAGEYLPLFNVVRVDFTALGGGRPSRKYLRLPIQENEQASGQLAPDFISFVASTYAAPLADLIGYVDVDDQELMTGSVSPFVGMRQLRRGSKRKLAPILP